MRTVDTTGTPSGSVLLCHGYGSPDPATWTMPRERVEFEGLISEGPVDHGTEQIKSYIDRQAAEAGVALDWSDSHSVFIPYRMSEAPGDVYVKGSGWVRAEKKREAGQ